MALPCPCGSKSFLYSTFCLPAEFLVCKLGVSPDSHHVTRTAVNILVVEFQIVDFLECGLGQTAPNPVLSTLMYFKDEYIEHIVDKKCRAGVCKSLLSFKIVEDKCKGCTKCARNCPVGAIEGAVKQVHTINQDKCIKCGACIDNCAFKAIIKE